jgi:hypothetical protein
VPAPKLTRDETLIKVLVRAHRWQRRFESGRAKSITELAEREGACRSYRSPGWCRAVLDGTTAEGLRLAEMQTRLCEQRHRRVWKADGERFLSCQRA